MVAPKKQGNYSGTRTRLTIGLVTDWLEEQYQTTVLSGVADSARERGVNLICFVGGALRSFASLDSRPQSLYDLARPENVDGLIIMAGALINDLGYDEIVRFCARYQPLPMISLGLALPGIPGISVDNQRGLYNAIAHLIEVHGYRRIAFIRGPENNPEAEERYNVYLRALAEHSIPFDPYLVAPGNFRRAGGVEAARLLLERGSRFDAIVSANDTMALGALETLQAHGLKTPGDVAMTGFDDIEDVTCIPAPLTTVRQPLYEQGRRACDMLLDLIAGKELPEWTFLETELVVRQSCGCLSQAVLRAAAQERAVAPIETSFQDALRAQHETVLAETMSARRTKQNGITPQQIERVMNAFLAEINGGQRGVFATTLNEALRQSMTDNGDVESWQDMLSALRRHALPYLSRDGELALAENLWQQGRVLVGEAASRVQAYRRLQAEQHAQVLGNISGELTMTFDLERLTDVLAENLPRLGIEGCYLSLYEGEQGPGEWSWLILAYDKERGRIPLDPATRRFPAYLVAPAGILPKERQYALVAQPLYFGDTLLGVALFEMGPRRGTLYERLRFQIASSLQGALLLTKRQQAENQLAHRAAQLALLSDIGSKIAAVSDLNSVLDRAVRLIHETFGYHHAAIFLLDHEHDDLVMKARAGDFAHLFPPDHRLKKGRGMVGWVGAEGQTLLANDVSAEPRYVNLYPDIIPTRSELSVPIRIGAEIVGVLDVQSPQPGAFDENDILVIETLGNQIASAIENARLYEAVQQELAERRRAEEALAQKAQELARSNEELQQFFYVSSHHLQEPLRMVVSYTQLLERRYKGTLDKEADEFIAYAIAGAMRIQRLINDQLNYARIGSRRSAPKPTDVSAILDQALDNLRPALEQNKATVTRGEMPIVTADPAQLTTVFYHLIDNALKFRSSQPPCIHIAATSKENEWVFSVRDNGIGIDPRYFGRIFKIFQRLHSNDEYPGTGIGLAICKKIIELHGGRIWVESEPGQGATFYFTIPNSGGAS